MKIGEPLKKILEKQYAPDSMISRKIGMLDVAFRTDKAGNPVSAFVGKLNADGRVKGERLVRVIVKDPSGKVVKDYWEGKGKT